MNLDDVAIFCEVVRRGSFTAAARALHVSPSHASRRVAALEDALGARLLQRTTRTLSCTEIGAAYHARTAPLLEELGLAAELVGSQEPSGLLRVAAPTALGCEHVSKWAADLTRAHPELRVELSYNTRAVDLVGQGLDVALRLGRLANSSLIAAKLCEMPRYIVASPEYLTTHPAPTVPQDLCSHDCLVFPFDGFDLTWSFRDAQGRVERHPVYARHIIGEGMSLRALARAGAGLTLLPDWMVLDDLRTGRLVRLFPDWDVTTTEHDAAVWMLYPSREHIAPKVQVFLTYVRELFSDGPPWGTLEAAP